MANWNFGDDIENNNFRSIEPQTPVIESPVVIPSEKNITPVKPIRIVKPRPVGLPFLNEAGQTRLTNGTLISPNYKTGEAGWGIDAEGNAEFNNGIFRGDVRLGNTARTVDSADEIQSAIDDVSADGGGTIYLAPGTYNLSEFIDIPSNVYLIGASRSACILDFGGVAFGVRSIGTVGTHISNVFIHNLTIQNSSISGLKLQYNDFSGIDGVDVTLCNIGIEMDNIDSTGIYGSGCYLYSNATNLKITTSTGFTCYYSSFTDSTSGHGVEFNAVTNSSFFDSGISDNTGDGFNITSCSNIAFVSLDVSGNGGQGLELVSGNNDLQFIAVTTDGNTSDGYKLTASSDRCIINACSIINNGGYGINIAAVTCDNNQIIAPAFDSNTSGNINDSGNNTSIISGEHVGYTQLTNSYSDTNANSYSTASVTPSANKLVLVAVYSRLTGVATTPTISGNSLTYVQVATRTNTGPDIRMTLFRSMGASPTAGAITINFGGVSQEHCAWSVTEFENVDTSGTNGSGAIVQSNTALDEGTNIGLSIPLSGFNKLGNARYGVVRAGNAVSPGGGFEELCEETSGEFSRFEAEFSKTVGSYNVNWSWSSTGTNAVGVACEIKIKS